MIAEVGNKKMISGYAKEQVKRERGRRKKIEMAGDDDMRIEICKAFSSCF